MCGCETAIVAKENERLMPTNNKEPALNSVNYHLTPISFTVNI